MLHLSETDREECIAAGAAPFAPHGRSAAEYVEIQIGHFEDRTLKEWIARGMRYLGSLPPKLGEPAAQSIPAKPKAKAVKPVPAKAKPAKTKLAKTKPAKAKSKAKPAKAKAKAKAKPKAKPAAKRPTAKPPVRKKAPARKPAPSRRAAKKSPAKKRR